LFLFFNFTQSKAQLEQSMLQQSQLREDIADKDEQISHLKEAQDIQMKSVSASVANTDILFIGFYSTHIRPPASSLLPSLPCKEPTMSNVHLIIATFI
jgi:hypothetical protein